MATHATRTKLVTAILTLGICLFTLSAKAEVSCPIEDIGGPSNSCLGGQCNEVSVFNAPCIPPSWAPLIIHWMWCGGTGEDGDGTTAVVARCDNECNTNSACGNDLFCDTTRGGGYSGGGNGLCVEPDIITPPPDEIPANEPGCDSDETWVPNPTPQHTGGQCQLTDELVACCYIQNPLSACRLGVPTECPDNGMCATNGFCFERSQVNPGLLEPVLNRDPGVFPPPPSEARPGD